MDHVGLFLARLILTPMLLYICNKYDLGRARAKKKKKSSLQDFSIEGEQNLGKQKDKKVLG